VKNEISTAPVAVLQAQFPTGDLLGTFAASKKGCRDGPQPAAVVFERDAGDGDVLRALGLAIVSADDGSGVKRAVAVDPRLRRVCAWCGCELPESVRESKAVSHGVCVPPCAEGRQAGF
jgi:hypothetical protein